MGKTLSICGRGRALFMPPPGANGSWFSAVPPMTHLYSAEISGFHLDPFRLFVFILQRLTLIDIHAPSFIHFRRRKVFETLLSRKI